MNSVYLCALKSQRKILTKIQTKSRPKSILLKLQCNVPLSWTRSSSAIAEPLVFNSVETLGLFNF